MQSLQNRSTKSSQLSTGPRTVEGKAIVAKNRLAHGVLSNLPVLPKLENADEWDAHRGSLVESIQPQGALESTLAERVALLLWRLRRVARYETEAIATAQESAEDDVLEVERRKWKYGERPTMPLRPSDEASTARTFAGIAAAVERVATAPTSAPIRPGTAQMMLDAAESVAANTVMEWDGDIATMTTAGAVRAEVAAIAARHKREPGEFLEAIRDKARHDRWDTKLEADKSTTALKRLRRDRLLPNERTAELTMRYESHLERCLYRALHQLERLQALRAGKPVVPPVAIDVTVE